MANHKFLHYLVLVLVIAVGTILRFWHLDLKPLWLDEVITALFSFGKSYNDVPLDVVFPLSQVKQIFTLKPGVSCNQIAHNLATQSTHPPLFFCLMHNWIETSLGIIARPWVWQLRALSALFGVAALVAIYCLNRFAFSPAAGLWGAGAMAVSPFAVYLSQEARHYTLPIFLITLSLLGLIQIQQLLHQPYKLRPSVWLGWIIVNIISIYVHYFCLLTVFAQIATLFRLAYQQRSVLPRQFWMVFSFATTGIAASYIPWLSVALQHFHNAETNWLPPPQNVVPIFQTLVGWLLMVIALPVEAEPLFITVLSGLLMILFGGWLTRYVWKGVLHLWRTPTAHLATLTLLSFTLWSILEFFAIIYFLSKDLSAVPRYNFFYYPSICALLGASLVLSFGKIDGAINRQFLHPAAAILLIGVISCVFVVNNLVWQKPFYPEQVAHHLNQESDVPLMVVVGYGNFQDVALGLSFALALEKIRASADLAFFQSSPNYDSVWQHLAGLPSLAATQLNLWIIASGLEKKDYPLELVLAKQANCCLDPENFYRVGVPYQLYRCSQK